MAKHSEKGTITFVEFTGGNVLLFDEDCPDDANLPAHIAALTGKEATTICITSIQRSISQAMAVEFCVSGIFPNNNQSIIVMVPRTFGDLHRTVQLFQKQYPTQFMWQSHITEA